MPLWRRSRPNEPIESGAAAPMGGGLLARAETAPSPSAAESRLVDGRGADRGSFFRSSDDGGDDYPGAEVATLKAEEELWEARQASERRGGAAAHSTNKTYRLPWHSSVSYMYT